jgi:hypothetical protein
MTARLEHSDQSAHLLKKHLCCESSGLRSVAVALADALAC